MALPIVGKYLILPVLLLLFYVCYGFRIRESGSAGLVEHHSTCLLDLNKCPDVDTKIDQTTATTTSSKKNHHDTGGVGGGGRIRFGTGNEQKIDGGVKKGKRDNAKEVKVFGYSTVRLKTGINKVSISDDRDDNISDNEDNGDDKNFDDDDDDVIIEDDDEFDEVTSEDNESIKEGDGSNSEDANVDDKEGRNDDENELKKVYKSSSTDSKWTFLGGNEKLDIRDLDDEHKIDDDNDFSTKRSSISKRIDGRRISNRDVDPNKRMKNEKMRVKKRVENFNSEIEDNEFKGIEDGDGDDSKVDDVDDKNEGGNYDFDNGRESADVKIKIPTIADKFDNKSDKILSEKNVLLQRKLERVRFASKDKLKPIESPNIKAVKKEFKNVEWDEKVDKITNKKILKIDSPVLLIEKTEGKVEKYISKETQEIMKSDVEKHVERVEETSVKSTKKNVKKKANVIPEEMKEKMEKQLKMKSKSKEVDSDNKKNISENKKKSSVTKNQAESPISLNKLNNEILRLPNFVPNFTAIENSACQQHGKIFLRQFRGCKLWALQMLDSSAKIPSGLLRGNVNQLGDYDQCLGISTRVRVDEKTVRVQGKYCLANIDIYASLPDMKVPVNLIQSRNFLRGTMHDTGHFVPKFTTINWAVCLPDACSATDAQIAISSALNYLNNTSGLKFIVDVDPNMCYVHQRTHNYSKETIGVLYFYAMICCLVFIATLRDFFVNIEEKANYSERIIMSFSMRRTLKILMKPVRVDTDDINCIHGIRSLATIALYIAHKMIPIAGLPYSNRILLTEVSNNPLSCLLRVSIVYTDSFLILSGVLSAFNMSKEAETRGEIRWFCRFVARFIRLTPALLVVIFWYAYVMEHIGSGPQWNIMKKNAKLCKLNSWTNLLYIQNFFPFEEMCATHTHQLALDMQLSLLAPILVYFLQVKPIIGILLMFFLLQVSATIRYFVTTNNYLSVVIFHGMTAKHLYKTANLTYAVSIHRITPYLFGVGLGVLMHYTGKNVKIYRIFAIFGWIVALLLGFWSIFSPWPMARRDYVYDPESNAQYTVLGPVSWALALCWVIFVCFTNNAGMINRFLSNYWLVVFSRISYSVYLTQFAVFFYNLATTRYSSEFQVHRAIDIYEIATVIIISTVLTLFFDIPMQEVKSVLMDCTDVNGIKANGIKSDVNDHNKQTKTLIDYQHCGDDAPKEVYNKPNGKKKTLIVPDFYDDKWGVQSCDGIREVEPEYENRVRERRRSKSVQKSYIDHDVRFHREITPSRYQNDNQRNRRSLSKPADGHFKQSTYRDECRMSKRDQSEERRRECLGKLSQKKPVSMMSSGSEDELLQRRITSPRHPVERPRVSDEEDWEQELRIRRRRFMERMASEVQDSKSEKENSQDGIMRRSSAEGKIALLTGTTECRGMDAWTVSRGSRISSIGGLSQDHSDTEEDSCLTGEYEQSEEEYKVNIPLRMNITEEEDKYELELLNINDMKTTIGIRQSSQEEIPTEKTKCLLINEVTPVATGKLFKRESIVKSQASEEDPEYLLPERPKLVEQEQEHPFKKAWQMQKSRSEEDGPSAFTIREVKPQQNESSSLEKKSSSSMSHVTPQTFQLVVEDVDLNSQHAYHDDVDNRKLANDVNQGKHDTDKDKSIRSLADVAELSKVDQISRDEELNKGKNDRRDLDASDQDNIAS